LAVVRQVEATEELPRDFACRSLVTDASMASVQRLVEQPVDIGDILDGGTRVGRVRYHLSVYQQFSLQEDKAVPTSYDVEGRISPLDPLDLGELHRKHVELTLRLADGRLLDFSVADEGGTIRSTGRGLYDPEIAPGGSRDK
jgi:hypothetical protein